MFHKVIFLHAFGSLGVAMERAEMHSRECVFKNNMSVSRAVALVPYLMLKG